MTLITTTSQLEELCKQLEKSDYITVDTEFLRDKYYYPKLCLIQVASEDVYFAADPLSEDMDLTPLLKIFDNEKIVKVFHAAKQDIEIIFKLFEKMPKPLFDTQIAAMVCGFGASASYASLVAEFVGKDIDKSMRFTDWSKRPLSEKQVNYALSDVTYLRDVYKGLDKILEETKRTSWMLEETNDLLNPENYVNNPEDVWKKIKLRNTSPKFVGIVKEIAQLREEIAQEKNKPRGFILKDNTILEIAALNPKAEEDFSKIRSQGRLDKKIIDLILKAIEKAQPIKLDTKENSDYKIKQTQKPIVELLKVLLKIKAAENNVAERLIASGDDLYEISLSNDADVPAMHGWRYDIFGKYTELLKNGDIALAIKDGDIKILESN